MYRRNPAFSNIKKNSCQKIQPKLGVLALSHFSHFFKGKLTCLSCESKIKHLVGSSGKKNKEEQSNNKKGVTNFSPVTFLRAISIHMKYSIYTTKTSHVKLQSIHSCVHACRNINNMILCYLFFNGRYGLKPSGGA